MLQGVQLARRQHRQRSARAGLCTGEHVISHLSWPARYLESGARRGVFPGSKLGAAAARATQARAAASRSSIPLSTSKQPHHLGLRGGLGRGEGREEGLLWERRGIPPSTERSRLFTYFTSAAGGNPRLQLLLTSPRGATAPRAPLPPGPPGSPAPTHNPALIPSLQPPDVEGGASLAGA